MSENKRFKVCWNCYYKVDEGCAIHKHINIHDKKYCEDYRKRISLSNKVAMWNDRKMEVMF